jgi:hypothetical protein
MKTRIVALLSIVFSISVGIVLGFDSNQGGQKSALVTVIAGVDGSIKDLTAKDFVVKEDKTTREVLGAELATDPLSVAILIDTAQPTMGAAPATRDLRAGVSMFVKMIQAASRDAQIALLEFAGAAVPILDFTGDGAELDKAIQRLGPNPQGNTVLLEAITRASQMLSERPAPRRAIVSIDFRSPEMSGEQAMKKTADEVRKAGTTVWAISIGSAAANSSPAREAVLNTVTQASGGLRLTAFEPSGLEGLLKQVANSLISQYTITFARPGDGQPKNVRMETTRGAKVLLTPWMR